MITVGYLKKRLADLPDDAVLYVREGKVMGIVILARRTILHPLRRHLTTILADDFSRLQDTQEVSDAPNESR